MAYIKPARPMQASFMTATAVNIGIPHRDVHQWPSARLAGHGCIVGMASEPVANRNRFDTLPEKADRLFALDSFSRWKLAQFTENAN
jgi:hypothetical protein